MSKLTLQQLVTQLQGKSMTYGWDAITLYDQRKANELLFQLYVERFNTENGYIEPASMLAQWGDGSYQEHIYGLRFSAPRLSFESADPSLAAVARLTMDMIGGMIVSTKKNAGGPRLVSKILRILPVGGPQLWMSQPVTKGRVDAKTGDVLIDIKNADKFVATFGISDIGDEQVGLRFKEYFEKNIPDELKVFPLGRLDGSVDHPLAPQNFEIRTMKSDPVAAFGDERYGDGAVMLFITLKGGQDGTTFPNASSTYLIPDDGNGEKYTGAMLLASRVLFEGMREQAIADIGYGIDFLAYTPANGAGQDVAWSLNGAAGGLENKFTHHYKVRSDDFDATFEVDLNTYFKADEGGKALTVEAGGSSIKFVWNKKQVSRFSRVIYWDFPSSPEWDYGDLTFDCQYSVNFDVVLSKADGKVSFSRNEQTSALTLKTSGYTYLADLGDVEAKLGERMRDFFDPKIRAILQKISTPTLDTFLLRNLLFPGHNALQLTEAFVPGDLAVFGDIDPSRTSTVLSPPNSIIEAGSTVQFVLNPLPAGVTWSARNVDSPVELPELINSTGLFTAPPQSELADGAGAFIVTARGTVGGTEVQSSALVSVIDNLIVVNPTYESCDPREVKILTAESLAGGVLEWSIVTSQWGSTLETVPGEPDKRKYTAGGSTDDAVPFSMDKVQIKQTLAGNTNYAFIHVLIVNQMITTDLYMTEDSDPSTGRLQFEMRGKNGPIDPGRVTWTLLSGDGTFNDKTGEYAEPATVTPGSFIVVSGMIPGDFANVVAYAAVPLPLTTYAELIESVDASLLDDSIPDSIAPLRRKH